MPKIDIDDLIEKMLEHSGKYPELKTYADGLKEVYRASKEKDKKEALTQKPKERKLPTVGIDSKKVSFQDILGQMGAGE